MLIDCLFTQRHASTLAKVTYVQYKLIFLAYISCYWHKELPLSNAK